MGMEEGQNMQRYLSRLGKRKRRPHELIAFDFWKEKEQQEVLKRLEVCIERVCILRCWYPKGKEARQVCIG